MPHSTERRIIHVDMDCFYAAVEVLDHPELAGKPVAVGGRSRRGVLTTCNYEARKFGVRSAMATWQALERCPHLIIRPTRFERYRELSEKVRQLMRELTPQVEPLSLDEAYLDVSHRPEPATRLARLLRGRIREGTGLTASAGIAPNKLIAKVASDWRKPDGQYTVPPWEVAAFMKDLPVKQIWGLGPKSVERLAARGIRTCGDLQALPLATLADLFGRFGVQLHDLCRGIDDRPVEPDRIRKSMSTERTFSENLPDLEACQAALPPLIDQLAADLEAAGDQRPPITGLKVKLKFADFSLTTAERRSPRWDPSLYGTLLEEGWERQRKPVRLLGVGVRFAVPETGFRQLELPWQAPVPTRYERF
ncbi:MAG: DNA polymerase IV [Opitutales bacterium]